MCAPRETASSYALHEEDARASGHHEAVALPIEGTASGGGIVVAGRHRADDAERADRHRAERRFRAARHRRANVAARDRAIRVADRHHRRRTRIAVRDVGTVDTEVHADVARSRTAEHQDRQPGRTAPIPFSWKRVCCSSPKATPPSAKIRIQMPISPPLPLTENFASSSASRVPAIANCAKRSVRRIALESMKSAGSKPSTSPAIWVTKGLGSKRVMRRTALVPASPPSHIARAPMPSGETAPDPVTTTRC